VNHGATVLNMSLGGAGDSAILDDIIQQALAKGIVIFAAAGNQPVSTPTYPAALPGVNAVTALGAPGQLASYDEFRELCFHGPAGCERGHPGLASRMWCRGHQPPRPMLRNSQRDEGDRLPDVVADRGRDAAEISRAAEIRSGSVGEAAVFDEGAHEHAHRGDEQPRAAVHQQDDTQPIKKANNRNVRMAQRKFHRLRV